MIECPWCQSHVYITNDICPNCKHEVLLNAAGELNEQHNIAIAEDTAEQEHDIEAWIAAHYQCEKCRHRECLVNEVAMTGTGISKLLDIQYQHYLFVSCCNCGNVTIYDPNVIEGKLRGGTSSLLDIFFG